MRRTFIVWFGSLLLGGCSAGEVELTMVKPRLAIDREVAEEIVRVFAASDGIRIRLIELPDATRPAVSAIAEGVADIALVSNIEAYSPHVATVTPVYPTVLHIAHRAELPETDTVNLIRGRSVYAGPPGSVSRVMLEAAALRRGMDTAEIRYVDDDRCADVLVVYAPILPEITGQIRECGDYRLLSLGDPGKLGEGSAVDSITLLNPKLKPFVIPADTYGSDLTPTPVLTLAVDKLLVASDSVPEAVIYDLLSELLRLQPALSAIRPGLFHQLSDDFDSRDSTFVLHPGAEAYLLRHEPDFYERYSGVAEVLVTLLIGLVSGGYAVLRIYNIRRKNRIDQFCAEAIRIRDLGRSATSPDARNSALAEIGALQDRAYELMIEEKLAADESFRIFITLSDDVRHELESAAQVG